MARAKYQVLVLPFRTTADGIEYCIFKRSDFDCWQFIAGGGETEDESILISAQREAFEEACIPSNSKYICLETKCSISTECFPKACLIWGNECRVIPEYSFTVEITDSDIVLSHEHTVFEWVDYKTANQRLKYDSNKVALWELNNKIKLNVV